jgi:hypothetical protein
MASVAVPKGKSPKGLVSGGKISPEKGGSNSMGIPDGQAPGFGRGNKEVSLNQLPSTARVLKAAKSNLMTGMSQNRGPGGNK